jgi:hypothetical protein
VGAQLSRNPTGKSGVCHASIGVGVDLGTGTSDDLKSSRHAKAYATSDDQLRVALAEACHWQAKLAANNDAFWQVHLGKIAILPEEAMCKLSF